jgi:DsbC/DsbD-like thiol-disulfide interchange protein
MKKLLLYFLLLMGAVTMSKAQIDQPVRWRYGIKKLQGNTYQVHLQATIKDGWHIYAQEQGSDFIGTATKIDFKKIPGVTLVGKPAGIGKKDTYIAKEAGVTNIEYAGKVDFVQEMTIKPGVKKVTGSLTYQTCTHEKCLPEETINFSVPVP